MDNYILFHIHTDLSLIDSATKFETYIKMAKECGMKSIGFSEHGNVFQWVKKKQICDKYNIKYIHAQEFYITKTLDEKVRDNWHCVLIALNHNGVKELNKLSSIGYNKSDNHFYYDPRISIKELISTSKNIAISTACLGGILNKADEDTKKTFKRFLKQNKNRCFLEIQPHIHSEQQFYNRELYEFSRESGVPLIMGTDTHSINKEAHEARKILQTSKKMNYSEDGFNFVFQTYDEILNAFSLQKAISKDVYLEAINNTNKLANMVEDFDFDLSFKYPKLYKDSVNIFENKIYDSELYKIPEYKARIDHEINTIKKNGAIDYFLLQENIINHCNNNNIWQGYSRGSISGSVCAYILKITDIDAIKWNTSFERFMNPERVSLSDIDIDYPPNKRDDVKKYIFNIPNLFCSDTITFNTNAKKGAIRDVGRALNIPLEKIDEISKNIEIREFEYRDEYPELFKYVDLLQGISTSVGSHPCGSVVSPINISEELGIFYSSDSEYPISQVDMKCIDSLNFVKLDILGLDNIQLINETCDMVGMKRITPDNIDFNDTNVWNSISDSNVAIFQWESDYAGFFYRKLFNVNTLKKIEEKSNKITKLDLFSMGNGAIRPGGETYRDSMCEGKFNNNGHPALDKFLSPTLGYLVYQEQVIEFLNKFCGFTMGEADLVRRGFAKKTGTDQFIPKIRDGFIETMKDKYQTTEEESENIVMQFLEVIKSCSDYLFSYNHSISYSMIGYVCAWLRYYHTGEFLSCLLNINSDNVEKTSKITEYAKSQRIEIKNIKFRKSLDNYTYDKNTNTIYKGISSIKYCNVGIGKDLYSIKDLQFATFIDFLVCCEENLSINSRQMEILIKLNMFEEFYGNKKLLNIFDEFKNGVNKYSKKYKELNKNKRIEALKEIENGIENTNLSGKEQIDFENTILNYIQLTYKNLEKGYLYVTGVNAKFSPKIDLYCLNNGKSQCFKVQKRLFEYKPLTVGDFIYVNNNDYKKKPKSQLVDGKWIKLEETEWWIEGYNKVEDIDNTLLNNT